MVSLVPHAETTAANLARVLRLHTLPSTPWEPHQRAVAARRLLEELGVRCDESAVLHDLKGFLLSSTRGRPLIANSGSNCDRRVLTRTPTLVVQRTRSRVIERMAAYSSGPIGTSPALVIRSRRAALTLSTASARTSSTNSSCTCMIRRAGTSSR